MTRVFDDPAAFAEAALAGFAPSIPATCAECRRRGPGGGGPRGQVAVVIGGGSGHYPAFAGLVGPDWPPAAVCGEIFASPSAWQAYRVARAV